MNAQVDLFELRCFEALVDELTEPDAMGMVDDKFEDFLVKLARLVGAESLLSSFHSNMSWLYMDVFEAVAARYESEPYRQGLIYKMHPTCDLQNEDQHMYVLRKWKTIRLLAD